MKIAVQQWRKTMTADVKQKKIPAGLLQDPKAGDDGASNQHSK
jgi:hypothetical protein